MAVATFDTLKFSKALREAGVSEKQADAEATVLAEVFSLNFRELATKEDLKTELKLAKDELKGDIKAVRDEMKGLEERFDYKLKDLEQRLTSKIDQNQAKNYGESILVRWMLGLVITLCAGIAVRLVFFPIK